MPYEDGLFGKSYKFKPEDFRHVHFNGKQGLMEALYDTRNLGTIEELVESANLTESQLKDCELIYTDKGIEILGPGIVQGTFYFDKL